ncbi:hypothetical protein BIV60_16315 [Bacillus sp. MUM 116]|uniref:carboxypeptidase regulatory-like domain-containing protein n=1 Tax=Bacillus sp. MUM 116 TaxID=1678002 RepID=UPI0008F5B4F8|nr:carboxypeptidase regulatory-like domain-containing protein [Bacillus sp. MUM 116]OIK12461.1 hypothetical protein BIV60_16315 [Bacillus sp. MUM 116]
MVFSKFLKNNNRKRGGFRKNSVKVLISLLVIQLFLGNLNLTRTFAAASSPKIDRTTAANSLSLAIAMSKKQFPKQSTKAVLTNKEDYNNIYLASIYSQKMKAPLLLTEKKSLNSLTKKELVRLKVKEITVIANKKEISTKVESDLKKLKMKVIKIYGNDVTDTSIQVTKKINPSNQLIYLVSSKKMDYSATVPAVAMTKKASIIIVDPKKLNSGAIKYINQYKQKVQIQSLGLSATTQKKITNLVTISGKDTYMVSSNLVKINGQSNRTLYLVAKKNYQDAAIIAPLAIKEKSLVAIGPNTITADFKSLILTEKITGVKVFADKKNLSDNTIKSIYSVIAYQKKLPAHNGLATVNDNVKVLTQKQTNQLLTNIKTNQTLDDGSVKLRLDTIDPTIIKKNAIIALDGTAKNPMGGFLKVTDVKKVGNDYDVTFNQPSLDDVFQDLKLSINQGVNASNIIDTNLEPGVTLDKRSSNSVQRMDTTGGTTISTSNNSVSLKVNMDLSKKLKEKENGNGNGERKLSVSGTFTIKDIKITADVDKVLNVPINMDLNSKYKTENNLNISGSGKMEWKFKGEDLGKTNLGIGALQGVDVTDGRLPLGSLTFLVTPAVSLLKAGWGSDGYVPCPVGVTVFLVLTASGKIEAQMSFDYNRKTQFDRGISFGIYDGSPHVYKGADDGVTLENVSASLRGNLSGELGIGVDVALNIGGIMPLVLRADAKDILATEGRVSLNYDLLNKKVETNGCYKVDLSANIQVKAIARMAWTSNFMGFEKTNEKQAELDMYNKKWPVINKSACTLKSGVEGMVTDAATNLPIKNASVEAVNTENSGEKYHTKSASSGKYTLTLPSGTYDITFGNTGYKDTVLKEVKVEDDQITYSPKLEIIQSGLYGKTGTVGGVITDAKNGQAVSDATISIYEGLNVTKGKPVKIISTISDGSYELDLPTGHYTAVIEKAGYIKNTFIMVCLPDEKNLDYNATITPNLSSDNIRIVLSWGETPEDLDSHLIAPNEYGNSEYEIFWNNRNYYADDDTLMTELDVDDTTSFGPETITIHKQVSGTYMYSVWDYTNRYDGDSLALSNSGAKVDVYMGSTLVKTFYVPANQIGNKWDVFKLDGQTITPINTMENLAE